VAMEQKEIVAEYKKRGFFDTKRKEWLDLCLEDTEKRDTLKTLIEQVVKCKIEKDPELLIKNKGKVTALIQTELVKRHVQKTKQISGNTNTTINSDIKPIDKEMELLDQLNSILDSFAIKAASEFPVNQDELKKLTNE
jgi:predicted component of type VI protein secretion system